MRISLSKGSLCAAVQTGGGELVSLQREGTEYIWSGDPAFWSGQNPILFPIVGSLKEGKTTLSGKVFEMARHGFARRMEFQLTEQGEDWAVLTLRESPETLAQFPYAFSLQVRHQLAFSQPENADTLLLTPAGLLRPGAAEPMLRNGTVPLDYETFRRLDTLIFQGLQSGQAALRHKETGRGVSLDFQAFPVVAFWTKPGAPFLCMEPWQGCAAYENESGLFQDKPHVLTLAPGEAKTLAYRFRLLNG